MSVTGNYLGAAIRLKYLGSFEDQKSSDIWLRSPSHKCDSGVCRVREIMKTLRGLTLEVMRGINFDERLPKPNFSKNSH